MGTADGVPSLWKGKKTIRMGHMGIIPKRFGSWNKALEIAGLNKKVHTGSKDYYINLLKKWHEDHGRAPKKSDFMKDPALPHPQSIIRKFSLSWNEIILNLGLDPNIKIDPNKLSNEELLKVFKEEYDKIKPKNIDEFNNNRTRSPQVEYLEKRFKIPYNKIKKMLGIEDIRIHEFSDDEVIEELKRVTQILRHTPSTTEFINHSSMNERVVKNHFGSWNKGLTKAGLLARYKTPGEVHESDEELLQMYRVFSIKIGKGSTGANTFDLNGSDEIYSIGVFENRFGGINEVRKRLGLEVTQEKNKRKYSKKQLKSLLLKEKGTLGRRLTNSEINKNPNLPSIRTINIYFRTTSMIKVWKEIEG